MTTDNFCFYLQNRLIQSNQTGGQWYSDTSHFNSLDKHYSFASSSVTTKKKFYDVDLRSAYQRRNRMEVRSLHDSRIDVTIDDDFGHVRPLTSFQNS